MGLGVGLGISVGVGVGGPGVGVMVGVGVGTLLKHPSARSWIEAASVLSVRMKFGMSIV